MKTLAALSIRWQYISDPATSRMRLREVVAINLRRLRQMRDLSQEEIADRAGINRNYVGMLEREEHAATIDMLEKLAAVLDADPIEFFRRQQ